MVALLNREVNELLNGKPLLHQALLQPAPGQVQDGVLTRQPLTKLCHERTGKRQVGSGHVGHDDDEVGRIFFRHVLKAIHQGKQDSPLAEVIREALAKWERE